MALEEDNKIVYSVNISIEKDKESEWLAYMKKHITDVVAAAFFIDFSIRKIITSEFNDNNNIESSDNDHYTDYVIEYTANDRNHLRKYFKRFSEKLQEEHSHKFKGKFIAKRQISEDLTQSLYKEDVEKLPIGHIDLLKVDMMPSQRHLY